MANLYDPYDKTINQKINAHSHPSSYRFVERQYDIPRVHNFHTTLPIAVPYRMDATDYVFFNYPEDFPVNQYRVIFESMDNSSGNPLDRYRDIGPLSSKVELPGVYFSRGFNSNARIGLLPKNKMDRDPKYKNTFLPPYIGNLVRGSTYTIVKDARIVTDMGHLALNRTGVL